jgi:hypothetical protein
LLSLAGRQCLPFNSSGVACGLVPASRKEDAVFEKVMFLEQPMHSKFAQADHMDAIPSGFVSIRIVTICSIKLK